MKEKNEDIHLFILKEDRRRNRERVLREKTQMRKPSECALFSSQELAIAKKIFSEETAAHGQSDHFGSGDLSFSVGSAEYAEMGFEYARPEINFGMNPQIRGMTLRVVACSLISIVVLWLYVCSYGLLSTVGWTTPSNMILQGLLWAVIIVLALFEVQVLRGQRDARAR